MNPTEVSSSVGLVLAAVLVLIVLAVLIILVVLILLVVLVLLISVLVFHNNNLHICITAIPQQ